MHRGVVSVIQKERRTRGRTCTDFEYIVCTTFAFVGWGESGGRRREATKDNEVWEATMWTVAYLMLFGYHTEKLSLIESFTLFYLVTNDK